MTNNVCQSTDYCMARLIVYLYYIHCLYQETPVCNKYTGYVIRTLYGVPKVYVLQCTKLPQSEMKTVSLVPMLSTIEIFRHCIYNYIFQQLVI